MYHRAPKNTFFKNNIQRTRPLTDLADEYSTLFEEQLAAFEKERAKMKQDHDEKLDSLTSQLRKLKEDNATAKAEIECYKNQINRNGESFYMSHLNESLTITRLNFGIFWIFDPQKSNFYLNSSDCRGSKII